MNKILIIFSCVMMLVINACDEEEVEEYTPIPKLHIGEPFGYQCELNNYIQLDYDSLGKVVVLNFYKEEVTSLDYVEYDEQSCTFSFHKGETSFYRISWDYTSAEPVFILYGQNGMWYKMNGTGKKEYILEANDGMAVRMVIYRPKDDWFEITVNKFCIEEYEKGEDG